MIVDFQVKSTEMSASSISEAQSLVQRVAGPRAGGDSVKSSIVRAARRLGFGFTRTKHLWYGDAKRIDAAEMDRLREEAGRVEARLLCTNLLVMRERLSKTDSRFHEHAITALDDALRALGVSVGTVAVRSEE